MKEQKRGLALLGLVFITFLAAIQYVFLRNVPDSVSTFSFMCVTNVLGLLILGTVRFKKLISIRGKTVAKGALFALELTGFNFFLLLGARYLDAVVTSSVLSLYFVFITPMLLLLRKRVNFFSGIATVIAIIALILMFGADTETLFSSRYVIYLLIADVFFAAYVVSISILGEKEDSTQLTLSQMVFASLFSFVGWIIESAVSGAGLSLPTSTSFWLSALFIGVFIRAIYGILQVSCQKYVSALQASLIFSAEIVITLATNPILCRWMNMDYTPATSFQVVGAVLLIIATVMVDDQIMRRFGYGDLLDTGTPGPDGKIVQRSSVARKMIITTLTFSMIVLVISTITFLSAIYFIRTSAVENSQELGENASSISSQAMMKKLEESIQSQAADKALLAEQKLDVYSKAVQYAASYAHSLYLNPDSYPDREIQRPMHENAGIWAMQRALEKPEIAYEDVLADSRLLGNMEDIFAPIARSSKNIATIYMTTESGLMISYDPNSEFGAVGEESYFEFKDSSWYKLSRSSRGSAVFTDTYQDGYGRGLTITCVAPYTDAAGNYAGCVAMDILMAELNDSMVNDGIVDPSVATLIDRDGKYIAGKDVDPLSETMGSIFDRGRNDTLSQVGREILYRRNGVVSTGKGEDAEYVAFATINSTDWVLCIMSPVSAVIQPAEEIRRSIDQNTETVVGSVMRGIMDVIQNCLLLSALVLLFVTLLAGRFSHRISDPLKQLEEDVRQISGGNLERRTQVSTDDEVGSLANSFNVMTDSLQQYIADLKEVTANEQRIASELSVAANIQASMLPRNFEEFCRGRCFDLYATMTPAKEVGGDFYDFFLIDDDHLCLVMADVSGKGVPASLFMAISKTLIKNEAQFSRSPAEILTNVNNHLCDGNEGELFVTVWLAIIELSTGRGLAANAGHEHPVIRRSGGSYELVVYRHSPAVAIMEGMRFREHEFKLNPGDRLFVYTDGVTEATDADNRLFGTDRMLAALNRDPDAPPEALLRNVRDGIRAFVGGAPQFDDITMLGLYYKGENENV